MNIKSAFISRLKASICGPQHTTDLPYYSTELLFKWCVVNNITIDDKSNRIEVLKKLRLHYT